MQGTYLELSALHGSQVVYKFVDAIQVLNKTLLRYQLYTQIASTDHQFNYNHQCLNRKFKFKFSPTTKNI